MSEGTSYKNKTWFIAVKIAENLFAKNNTDKLIAQATIHYPIIKRRNNVLPPSFTKHRSTITISFLETHVHVGSTHRRNSRDMLSGIRKKFDDTFKRQKNSG